MSNLSTVFANSVDNSGSATDGVQVTAYGQGQVSGVTYTVPAHADVDVDFTLNMQCVTPENVNALDQLIRSLLSASKQHEYDQLTKKTSSGGRGFFLFFSGGGSHSSYSQTTHTMDSWGLTREQQSKIIDTMMELVNKTQRFEYKGTIQNTQYDYSVSGSMFGIVMDVTIQKDEKHTQVRFLAPNLHLQGNDGSSIPTVNPPLYQNS